MALLAISGLHKAVKRKFKIIGVGRLVRPEAELGERCARLSGPMVSHRARVQIEHDVVGKVRVITLPGVERDGLVQHAPETERAVHVAPKGEQPGSFPRHANIPQFLVPE